MENMTVTCSIFKDIIVIRYLDHVQYSRASALVMSPQIRETVGWLVYECDQYITLSYDRDVGPPTLKGGDPKASGLVLLKSVIVDIKKFDHQLQQELGVLLNASTRIQEPEYALRYREAKNSKKRNTQT